MFQKVQKMKNDLKPWNTYVVEDLTKSMNYKYKTGTSKHLTGKIKAKDGSSLIAFDRVERGLKTTGYMFASSTDFDIFYDIRGLKYSVTYNNEVLGDILESGVIVDSSGAQIGHSLHPPKIAVNLPGFRSRSGDPTFPFEMNGRLLATINVAPNHGDKAAAQAALKSNENKYGQQTLQLHDTPTEQEEKWLRSLAILETAIHGHWLI